MIFVETLRGLFALGGPVIAVLLVMSVITLTATATSSASRCASFAISGRNATPDWDASFSSAQARCNTARADAGSGVPAT